MRIRDWDPNLKVRLFSEAMMNITFWMFFPFLTIYFADEFGNNGLGNGGGDGSPNGKDDSVR